MLTEYWKIDTGFPEANPKLAEALKVATGTSFFLILAGEFDSLDKPLTKKRNTGGPQESILVGNSLETPSNSEDDMVVTGVVVPTALTPRPTLRYNLASTDNAHILVTVVVRLACGVVL
jgi:hypothetical protein